MKTQLVAIVAILAATGASLVPGQPDQGGLVAAAVSPPFPFSDPHTVKNGPRGLDEISSCSTAVSFETQDPVAAAPAETSMVMEDTDPGTDNPAVTDCITGGALPAPSPSASTPSNPAQPNEAEGSRQSSPVSPCPESPQESGPASASETPEAGLGGGSPDEANPAPTGNSSSPLGQGQMAPTGPCDSIVSNISATSAATNQTLTTVVVQPAQKIPSTTLPLDHSETQAPPEATGTGPAQASAGSRSWTIGAPTTVFAFGLIGGWLAV